MTEQVDTAVAVAERIASDGPLFRTWSSTRDTTLSAAGPTDPPARG
ncbi:hypothetical protein AB0878_36875 [Amycolatopsis sp. NPDC047767]